MPTLLELKAANKANIRDKTAPGSATRANVADALDAGLDFSASLSIDYANPVALTAAATLQVNQAYYVSGSGYALTLPDPAANPGKALFISIASTATGLYPVNGAGALAMYAAESILLRATTDGWKKTGGELLAMSARTETTLAQQDPLPAGVLVRVPCSVVVERVSAVPGLVDLANSSIVVQRAGRATIGATVALADTQAGGAYFFLVRQVRAGATTTLYQTLLPASPALAQGGFSYSGGFLAGDVLTAYLYNNDGQPQARLRGQFAGSQATFTFLEIV